MDKLDRLGWAAAFSMVAFGTRVGIRATDPGTLKDARSLIPPVCRPTSRETVDRMVSLVTPPRTRRAPGAHWRGFHILYGDGMRVARTLDRKEFFRIVGLFLEELIMASARNRCVVHAGAVGWRGRAILIPGPSMAGKSRLVEALLHAGATYLSDEYAILDGQGRVHPYPRPLRRREADGSPRALRPDDLGAKRASRPLPVGLVVAARYRAGARWRSRSLSPGEGLLSLLAHSISARMWSDSALRILRACCSQAPSIRAIRGEADAAAAGVIACCEGLWGQQGAGP
jgi:hypothetical protein